MKTLEQIIQETISCIPNGKIYLIEAISDKAGLFCSNGDILYLVINSEGCSSMSVATEFLQMDTDVFIQSFDEQRSFPDAEYNVLRYRGSTINEHIDNVESFVNLCMAHAKLLNGDSFEQFFYSLISLFQLPREQNYLNLMGLLGELSVIKHIYLQYGIDISPYWHLDGSFSKYDFSLPNKSAIEIKSSSKGDKAVSIKHSQLFSGPATVCLTSVQVCEDSSGITLEELINSIRDIEGLCCNLQFEISLQKELKRVSQEQMRNKRFIFGPIHYFENNRINPFPLIPERVCSLEYVMDLSDAPQLTEKELSQFFI